MEDEKKKTALRYRRQHFFGGQIHLAVGEEEIARIYHPRGSGGGGGCGSDLGGGGGLVQAHQWKRGVGRLQDGVQIRNGTSLANSTKWKDIKNIKKTYNHI